MDRKVAAVFRAYLSLDEAQKRELIRTMNEYIEGTLEEKSTLRASAIKVDVGPLSSGGCPFCGK